MQNYNIDIQLNIIRLSNVEEITCNKINNYIYIFYDLCTSMKSERTAQRCFCHFNFEFHWLFGAWQSYIYYAL